MKLPAQLNSGEKECFSAETNASLVLLGVDSAHNRVVFEVISQCSTIWAQVRKTD